MPLEPLFGSFRPAIEACFGEARADAGQDAVALQIEEGPRDPRSTGRAEFLVIEPAGPVRITWNGIASLWVFCQAAARLGRRMFDGKRLGKQSLAIDEDPELERGLDSLELARRFCTQDVPAQIAATKHWPDWAPPIDPSPAAGSDAEIGNRFFFGALGWIFRHELAHLERRHAERQRDDGWSDLNCETDADRAATIWLKGGRQADRTRQPGAHPSVEEVQLEGRAISVGLGLIWVALFETDRGRAVDTHPPVADRIFACVEELEVREDSAAAEILSDIIQAWIAPEDNWTPEGGYPTADDAFVDAIIRLHRHLS